MECSANYSAISDLDYYQDFGNNGLTANSQSYLYRQGEINYRQTNWNLQAALQSYQLIDQSLNSLDKPYSSLPRINLDYGKQADSGLIYGLNAEYVYFDRNFDANAFSQLRSIMEYYFLANGYPLSRNWPGTRKPQDYFLNLSSNTNMPRINWMNRH